MKLEIDQAQIQAAIQTHLDETVKKGIDYRVTEQLNKAIAAAITPEVVSGYAAAAVAAMTDPAVTQRIVTEMQHAIAEAVRMTMQEAILSVAARLRGYRPDMNRDDKAKMDDLRARLFPVGGGGAEQVGDGNRESESGAVPHSHTLDDSSK